VGSFIKTTDKPMHKMTANLALTFTYTGTDLKLVKKLAKENWQIKTDF
jgi:hypothetical protein